MMSDTMLDIQQQNNENLDEAYRYEQSQVWRARPCAKCSKVRLFKPSQAHCGECRKEILKQKAREIKPSTRFAYPNYPNFESMGDAYNYLGL